MYVLYVSFGSTVRPRIFGCVAMGSEVLFILRCRWHLHASLSGVNRCTCCFVWIKCEIVILVCSSFLISVYVLLCQKLCSYRVLVIVRTGGAI